MAMARNEIKASKEEIAKLFQLINELDIETFAETKILLENKKDESKDDINNFIDEFPKNVKLILQLILGIDKDIKSSLSGIVQNPSVQWFKILPETKDNYTPEFFAKVSLLSKYFKEKQELSNSLSQFETNFKNKRSKLDVNFTRLKNTHDELVEEKTRKKALNQSTKTLNKELNLIVIAINESQAEQNQVYVRASEDLENQVENIKPQVKTMLANAEKERQQLRKSIALKKSPSTSSVPSGSKPLKRQGSGFFSIKSLKTTPSAPLAPETSLSDSLYPLPKYPLPPKPEPKNDEDFGEDKSKKPSTP